MVGLCSINIWRFDLVIDAKIRDAVLSIFFSLWIAITIFLLLYSLDIGQTMYLWVSVIFVVSLTLLTVIFPKIFEKLKQVPFSQPFKHKYQKCEINPFNIQGDTNLRIISNLINLGEESICERKHVVTCNSGEFPEEDTLKANDGEGNELTHRFITKSRKYWDFYVEFRSPIPRLGEINYSASIENISKEYPKKVTQHTWGWLPHTAIDKFEIEVVYNCDVEILNAKLIDLSTGRNIGETLVHKRTVISKVHDIGPGEYKLIWNTK